MDGWGMYRQSDITLYTYMAILVHRVHAGT